MLTESVNIIRYVFLLSVGLRPVVLNVLSGDSPDFSSWEIVRFVVSREAMSLDKSPLSTSREVIASGWTVCYTCDKSRNSGMAISLISRLVGLYRSVFKIIVMHSAYLWSLRLSRVLKEVTAISRSYCSIVGEDLSRHEKCGFTPCASGRIGRMRRTGKESFNMTTGYK